MCATNDPVFMVGQTSRVPSAVLPAPSRHSSFSNPFLHENPRREDVAGLRRGERAAQGRGDCVGRVPSGFGVRVRGASVRAGPQCCAPWCPERPRRVDVCVQLSIFLKKKKKRASTIPRNNNILRKIRYPVPVYTGIPRAFES